MELHNNTIYALFLLAKLLRRMIYMGLEIGLDVLEKFWNFIGKNVWEP